MVAFSRRAFFFDARPVLPAPACDRRLIALSSPGLGLLHAQAHRVQDAADVVEVVPDVEGLADQVAHASAGPQVVVIPCGKSALLEHGQESTLVRWTQSGLSSRVRPGLETLEAAPAPRLLPLAHA